MNQGRIKKTITGKWTLILIILMTTSEVFGQNFKLDERSTENYFNYFIQMQAVENSLKSKEINNKLQFADTPISEEDFKTLAKKFNEYVPSSFFDAPEGVSIIDTEKKDNPESFIKWTYIKLDENDEIKVYLQLIVYFDTEDDIYSPKVNQVEVLYKDEINDIDKRDLNKLFQKTNKLNEKAPKPPKF